MDEDDELDTFAARDSDPDPADEEWRTGEKSRRGSVSSVASVLAELRTEELSTPDPEAVRTPPPGTPECCRCKKPMIGTVEQPPGSWRRVCGVCRGKENRATGQRIREACVAYKQASDDGSRRLAEAKLAALIGESGAREWTLAVDSKRNTSKGGSWTHDRPIQS